MVPATLRFRKVDLMAPHRPDDRRDVGRVHFRRVLDASASL